MNIKKTKTKSTKIIPKTTVNSKLLTRKKKAKNYNQTKAV